MNPTNSDIIRATEYECRSGALTSSGVVTRRWRSSDMPTIRIPLNSRKYPGLYALVDEADYELVAAHRWRPQVRSVTVYARSIDDGSFMHRLILSPGHGEVVDHVNHDGLDNRRSNIRICTPKENSMNRRPKPHSSSRYKNVTYRHGKWIAASMMDGETYRLGHFVSEELAARVADRHCREMQGDFSLLNFPENPMTDMQLDAWIEIDFNYSQSLASLRKCKSPAAILAACAAAKGEGNE